MKEFRVFHYIIKGAEVLDKITMTTCTKEEYEAIPISTIIYVTDMCGNVIIDRRGE